MVATIQRIEREIEALEQSVAAIAQEFHQTYSQYLTALGSAVRQQLILATYHICTRGYPEQFLQLSFSQRQQLQQALRQQSRRTQGQLESLLLPAEERVAADPDENVDAAPDVVLEAEGADAAPEATSGADPAAEIAAEIAAVMAAEIGAEMADSLTRVELPDVDLEDSGRIEPLSLASEDASSDGLDGLDSDHALNADDEDDEELETEADSLIDLAAGQYLRQPEDLLDWQEMLEAKVDDLIKELSHEANRVLQQAGVLSKQLPEPVLEAAAKADLISDLASGPPNLLNLLVETESDDDETAIAQILAIHLRLSEIEFADAMVTAWRSKIRGLSTRLNHFDREYDKKLRERAIAEAEAAWRSSWFDE